MWKKKKKTKKKKRRCNREWGWEIEENKRRRRECRRGKIKLGVCGRGKREKKNYPLRAETLHLGAAFLKKT